MKYNIVLRLLFILNMEKRLNKCIEEYVGEFKQKVCERITNNEDPSVLKDLIEFVYEYPRLVLTKENFEKRKRVKNKICDDIRCCAKRANDERCTRRKKDGSDFCGTHSKGTPNGTINEVENKETTVQLDVEAHNIDGIIYYIDKNNNIYKTEDILMEKQDPLRIGKCEINNGLRTLNFI